MQVPLRRHQESRTQLPIAETPRIIGGSRWGGSPCADEANHNTNEGDRVMSDDKSLAHRLVGIAVQEEIENNAARMEEKNVWGVMLAALSDLAQEHDADELNAIVMAQIGCDGGEGLNMLEHLELWCDKMLSCPDLWFSWIETMQGMMEYRVKNLSVDDIDKGNDESYWRLSYAMDAAHRVCLDDGNVREQESIDWCDDVAKAICGLDGIRQHIKVGSDDDSESALVHFEHVAGMIRVSFATHCMRHDDETRNRYEAGDPPAAILLLKEMFSDPAEVGSAHTWNERADAIIEAYKEKSVTTMTPAMELIHEIAKGTEFSDDVERWTEKAMEITGTIEVVDDTDATPDDPTEEEDGKLTFTLDVDGVDPEEVERLIRQSLTYVYRDKVMTLKRH